MFFILEMGSEGRERQELQLLLTQSEALLGRKRFWGEHKSKGLAAYQGLYQ